jgi:TonB family protein
VAPQSQLPNLRRRRKPKEQGVFEEWWASPDKYKISYSIPGFNQVQYHNRGKTSLTGDRGLVPFGDTMVEIFLVHPLPTTSDNEKVSYIVANRQLGQVPLVCAGLNASAPNNPPGATYCFDNQKPVLRLEQTDGNLFVLFNDIIRTGIHYVDKQITIQDSRVPIVKAQITDLQFPNTIEDSVLAIPASATLDDHLTVKASVMTGKKIGGKDIKYPPMATQQRIEGSVVLIAVITQSGDIADLDVISGPKELRDSSIEAIKTWKYSPYLLNGQPIEVRTEINVDYALSK